MYGPLAGGGLFVASLSSGVLGGTGAANGRPRMLSNVPLGSVSVMVMSPVASSVTMPLIVLAVAVGVFLGADDGLVEHRAAGVGLEQTLDGVGEVRRLDRRSVGVLHVGPQLELVGLAVGRHLGHGLGQAGHDLGALLALRVLVGQQRGVDVVQRLPTLDGVRQLRVDVVGERRHRHGDVAASAPPAASTGTASGVASTGRHSERGERGDDANGHRLAQLAHPIPLGLCPGGVHCLKASCRGAIASFTKNDEWQLGLSGIGAVCKPVAWRNAGIRRRPHDRSSPRCGSWDDHTPVSRCRRASEFLLDCR